MNKKSDIDSTTSAPLYDRLKWLTAKEAAEYLRTSTGQIRNMAWQGTLPSYKLGTRLRFLRTDLARLMKPRF